MCVAQWNRGSRTNASTATTVSAAAASSAPTTCRLRRECEARASLAVAAAGGVATSFTGDRAGSRRPEKCACSGLVRRGRFRWGAAFYVARAGTRHHSIEGGRLPRSGRVPLASPRRSAQRDRSHPCGDEHVEPVDSRSLVDSGPGTLRVAAATVPVVGQEGLRPDAVCEGDSLARAEVADDVLLLAKVVAPVDREQGELDPLPRQRGEQ